MSKIITSPVKKWAGTVTLSDPLTIPQVILWQECVDAAQKYTEEIGTNSEDGVKKMTAPQLLIFRSKITPGICECVEQWNLEGLGQVISNTFPASPKIAAADLFVWLVNEITDLFKDADEIPNA